MRASHTELWSIMPLAPSWPMNVDSFSRKFSISLVSSFALAASSLARVCGWSRCLV